MKNDRRGQRRGKNAPGPYSTRRKSPIEYSTEYREWFRRVTGRGKVYNGSSFDHRRTA